MPDGGGMGNVFRMAHGGSDMEAKPWKVRRNSPNT